MAFIITPITLQGVSGYDLTYIDKQDWVVLKCVSDYYDAPIKVSTFTYVRSQEGSEKGGRQDVDKEVEEIPF